MIDYIFIARVQLRFDVGIADGIKIHLILRRALLGLIMSLVLIPMLVLGNFVFGALLLIILGIFYAIIEDVVSTWVLKKTS